VAGRSSTAVWAVVAVSLAAGTAGAADCGGAVACRCGDRVVRDHVLTADLGPCAGHGLVVASGVTLDGAGHAIVGTGADDSYGIYLREATGAAVDDVVVSGFYHGMRLRDAHGCRVTASDFSANGDFAGRAGYGIDVAVGSSGNLFSGNAIHHNADEGIHFGSTTSANELRGNDVYANERENVYLLASNGNVLAENRVWGGRNSLFVKDSSHNRIEENELADATFVVRADSHENEIVENHLVGAGLHFQLYTDEKPYRSPRDNAFRGGSIRGASTCIRFSSSVGNRVVGTALADCGTQVRSESGHGPSQNSLVGLSLERSRIDVDAGSVLEIYAADGRRIDTIGDGGAADPPSPERDLALERIVAPRLVRLTGARPVRVRRVEVVVENRGTETEWIADASVLGQLVQLGVASTGPCAAPPIAAVGTRRPFPFSVPPGGRFSAAFEVELACANDPERGAPPEGDYRWTASLDTSALAGDADVDAANDVCPRPTAGGERGCGVGARRVDGGVATDLAR
jgi:parallel beta-helix repeat protein